MLRRLHFFLRGALLGGALRAGAAASSASTLYRIDFAGTIDSGRLLVAPTTSLSTIEVPFVRGGSVRGALLADLGAAPTPLVDGAGVHWTAPMSARLEVTLPALPDDVLGPIPSTFLIEESFGANLLLQFATTAQVVFSRFSFSQPNPGSGNFRNEGTFAVFLGPGPGIHVPGGALSPEFAATNLSGVGSFRVLKVDQTASSTPPLFGLNAFYDLSVSFTATEASGGFVPEPSTAWLVALAAPLLLVVRRRQFSARLSQCREASLETRCDGTALRHTSR
ncbi:MAG TPA: PEP-CTERM sorting domain-containing protein [Bryobacteraceae bacterium]|nr:PEP-CTERM sorting domain-containing protein [Bryobacteraceae bacterium]